MEKLQELIKRILTKEVIFYILFGVLTTIVNWVAFYILTTFTSLNENISNFIAILLSVIVAYITNKDMVFHSEANGIKEKVAEFFKFMAGRAFTMLLEWGLCAALFLTPIPQLISKVTVTILVVILNFFISKFFAFKKNK